MSGGDLPVKHLRFYQSRDDPSLSLQFSIHVSSYPILGILSFSACTWQYTRCISSLGGIRSGVDPPPDSISLWVAETPVSSSNSQNKIISSVTSQSTLLSIMARKVWEGMTGSQLTFWVNFIAGFGIFFEGWNQGNMGFVNASPEYVVGLEAPMGKNN
jgi:hypothetical protein